MLTNRPNDLEQLLRPVWDGNTIYEESFFALMQPDETEEQELIIPLLYRPDRILSVTSATRTAVMEEGVDYVLRDGALVILPVSAVKRMQWDEYQVLDGDSAQYPIGFEGEGGGRLFFGEGDTMHSRQYLVSYTHSDTWEDYIPVKQSGCLPRTGALLAEGKPISLCWFGDSITTGANSSGAIGAEPYIPAFPQLVSMALESRFGSSITYHNHAVGGTGSAWGCEQLPIVFADAKPDVMFIGFGMNDGYCPPAEIVGNIRRMVDQTLALNPECEFLICATTLPNTLAMGFYANQIEHEPLLAELCRELGPRAALVPMTSVHAALLKKKRFYDMSGNNVNHPCDFLARVYAQVILAQIV
ncbi:MAG: SGNH/GDSL hydrolase family protein [Clostridia bacterium]|nr:SGNH/GDSL hydrolase family protein [Clostridia bacterium]